MIQRLRPHCLTYPLHYLMLVLYDPVSFIICHNFEQVGKKASYEKKIPSNGTTNPSGPKKVWVPKHKILHVADLFN